MPSSLDSFEGCFSGREIAIVADGPTCPMVSTDLPILAVNHGFKNCRRKPWGMVYLDEKFRKLFEGDLSSCAEHLFYKQDAGGPKGAIPFRMVGKRQARLRDGIYCGGLPFQTSAGVAALSIAIGTGASLIHLFGYDYRYFSPHESMVLFGRELALHASVSNHRNTSPERAVAYLKKIPSFDVFVGAPVVNHSIHSNLWQFPRLPAPSEMLDAPDRDR